MAYLFCGVITVMDRDARSNSEIDALLKRVKDFIQFFQCEENNEHPRLKDIDACTVFFLGLNDDLNRNINGESVEEKDTRR